MNPSDRARLSGPGFARLFAQIRRRIEREPDAVRTGQTALRDPTPEERDRVGGLLGRMFHGNTVTVAFSDVDDQLSEATGHGLVAWLEALGGPLRDRPREDALRDALRSTALGALADHPHAGEPWFHAWIDELRAGILGRLLAADALDDLRRAAAILTVLPAEPTAMPVFASRHAGGTKALRGTRLERLVLRGLALRSGVPAPDGAVATRSLWEQYGVHHDDLAATVLALNLPATGDGLVDRTLRAHADVGWPVRLTLHQLLAAPPTLADVDVFVCENPAILRMASERLGPRSAPVVATEGYPSTAFWTLMRRHPGRVCARADFDADGLRIAGRVLAGPKAVPWRFDAETYRATATSNSPLPADMPPTPWDPPLADALSGGVRVEEEELLDALIADLDRRGRT